MSTTATRQADVRVQVAAPAAGDVRHERGAGRVEHKARPEQGEVPRLERRDGALSEDGDRVEHGREQHRGDGEGQHG